MVVARVVQVVAGVVEVATIVVHATERAVDGVGMHCTNLGIRALPISFCFSSLVIVALRVVLRRRLRFNGFQPRLAMATLLLKARAKDCAHAIMTNGTISYGSMVRFISFLCFCLIRLSFALLNANLYAPLCLLKSPTCHRAVPYSTPIQTDQA